MNLWLPLLVLLPLIGGAALVCLRQPTLSDEAKERCGIALAVLTLLLSLYGLQQLYPMSASAVDNSDALSAPSTAFEFAPEWLKLSIPSALATQTSGWQIGLTWDGIGGLMVLLTTIVTLAVLLIARSTMDHNRGDYAAWILVATGSLLLVFTAKDIILFYVGFELSLIPLFALIGGWGGRDGYAAAKRFVLYTLLGSVPMILALLGIAQLYGQDSGWTIVISELADRAAAMATQPTATQQTTQAWIFGLLVFGLGIKMAILPLHTWLPTTYRASHPTTAAYLAAVVLKLGLFGFVRLALPLVPHASAQYGPTVLGWLGAVAIVYGAMIALVQTDLRLLLAYSSLSHVGFVTIGLFALNTEGIGGGVLQMFNHGITTTAMFLLAACMIQRRGTPMLDEGSRGVASLYPRLAFFFVFFVVAGAGMPGLNNFVGESMTLTAMVFRKPVITGIGVLGVVLGAWYSFRLSQHLLFGKLEVVRSREPQVGRQHDLSLMEKVVFAVLAIICLWIGIVPQNTLRLVQNDAQRIGKVCDDAMNAQTVIAQQFDTNLQTQFVRASTGNVFHEK